MTPKTFHPRKFVVELWAGLRIAIWQVDRGNNYALDCTFDVSALSVRRVTRQPSAYQLRRPIFRQNGDAIPLLLAQPNGAIPATGNGFLRKILCEYFQFLQTDNVRLRLLQPNNQSVQAPVDVTDVVRRDFHRGGSLECRDD